MARMTEATLAPESLERFDLDPATRKRLFTAIEKAQRQLSGTVIWNVSSTRRGGGVAEMLQSSLAYARGAGIDARWLVLEGDGAFFHLTKRLHHALHGAVGDGSELDDRNRGPYESTSLDNFEEYAGVFQPGDIVLLHDPQTAGLAPLVKRTGAFVVWRCHIGTDQKNEEVTKAWAFLRPYLSVVDAAVFTRPSYVSDFLLDRSEIIPPSIDAFSPKNMELSPEVVRAILWHTGLVGGERGSGDCSFQRRDGAPGRVDRAADIVRLGPAPDWKDPLIVQVSRWDQLKDPIGVLEGFVVLFRRTLPSKPHLILAGPSVRSVADDPEAAGTLDKVIQRWRTLSHHLRSHVHLVCLPMKDVDENAVIVNALQRHAAVVVQKSLQDGFGLTVTEAMWKRRPLVASAVGGIQEQIVDQVHGLLVRDPRDPEEFATHVARMLKDSDFAMACGQRAHARVREHFLAARELTDHLNLFLRVVGRPQ